MKFIFSKLPIFIFFALVSQTAYAELQPVVDIPKKLNKFVDDVYKMSELLTSKTPHREQWRVGGYSNEPNFFDEVSYYNNETGKLSSIIQWERADPEAIHSIEVKLRDKQGRVRKDFAASYLTKHRNAPIQALITIHYYNKNLHGFRVFDTDHTRIYDVCRGTLNGKTVNIDLDDNYGELSEALEDKKGIMSSADYLACFGGRNYDKSRLKVQLD